jgi:hypothetical protein
MSLIPQLHCISAAPAAFDRYPCGLTGHVADPISSIALSVVVTDRRRRQCRGLSRGARVRSHRAHAGSIEIFPAARARGVTIPGLSEDYVFDDFEFALDLLAMISYSRADRTR